MTKELCIVHANCQGEPLIERLNCCEQFRERYQCVLFTNYIREPITDGVLSKCSLFLYQFLGPGWAGLSSANLLTKIPDNARSLCIPNMFFKGYWPTWSGAPGFDYRCTLLDSMIESGLGPEETLMLYLHTDIAARLDLDALLAQTLNQERQREAKTPIKYLDLIIEHCHDIRMFNTVNHPGPMLLDHVARGILEKLDMPEPNEDAMDALGDAFPEFEQPIHPKVGWHFGWPFAGPGAQYEIYGIKMGFARYVANYILARQNDVTDFIGFLQGDSPVLRPEQE